MRLVSTSVGPSTGQTTSRGGSFSQKRPWPWTFYPSGANPSRLFSGRAPRARYLPLKAWPATFPSWRTCFCGRAANGACFCGRAATARCSSLVLSGGAQGAHGVARRRRAKLQRLWLDGWLPKACLTRAELCSTLVHRRFGVWPAWLLVCYMPLALLCSRAGASGRRPAFGCRRSCTGTEIDRSSRLSRQRLHQAECGWAERLLSEAQSAKYQHGRAHSWKIECKINGR